MAESSSFACRAARQFAVGEIVRDVIVEAAPAELPVVDGLCKLGPDTARRRLRRRRRSRDPVRFGLDVVVPMMTPVAWIAVDELVRRVVDDASGGLAGRLGRALRAAARCVTRRPPARATLDTPVPPLSAAQLEEVRRRVLELAPKYYLVSEDAEALAERVVARLILVTTAPGTEGRPSSAAGKDPMQ